MTSDLDVNKTQALLRSVQELRTHWSGLINYVMYFAIVANVAVWTLFIQAYLDNFAAKQEWAHAYIVTASTISIILLVLWRLYTQYLDNAIASLYPELIYFEGKLSCPVQYGTSGYLIRNLGKAGTLLHKINNVEQKANVVARLVKNKWIGDRGHYWINCLTLVVIVFFAIIVWGLGIFEFPKIGGGAAEEGLVRPAVKWLFGFISIAGIISMALLLATWQKKPCKQQVQKIITKVKESDRRQTS